VIGLKDSKVGKKRPTLLYMQPKKYFGEKILKKPIFLNNPTIYAFE